MAKKDEKHWLEYATGVFAFLAAIGGILAAIFSGRQASIASDTERRQLRPYLYVLPADSSAIGQPDGSVVVRVRPQIKVFGQTMAGGGKSPMGIEGRQLSYV